MRPTPPALPLWIVALLALLLGAPAAAASPLGDTAVLSLAQQTGGSFGGSRWGSGSSSPSGGSSSPSGGGSYSPSSGTSSYGGGSSRSGGGDAGDAFSMIWILIQIVVWCFSISPVLGFGVLAVGLGFLIFVWMQRS